MHQDTSLKRNKLAQSIRNDQREKIKKQIRNKFNESIQRDMYQQKYNDEEFKKLKYQCRCSNFHINLIYKAIQYLCSKNIYDGLSQENNIKFVGEVLEKMGDSCEERVVYVKNLIKGKLMEVLQIQLEQSPKDEKGNICPTNQLSQLFILKNCFDGYLFLLQQNRCLAQLWIPLTQLRNRSLKVYSFQSFQQFITNNIETLSSQQITIISISLYNYLQDCPTQIHKFITLIDLMYNKYNIRPFDNIRFIDCLIQIISGSNVENKVRIIVEDTNIVENVTVYLDKSNQQGYKNSFDLVGKIAQFVAKLFSVQDEELCCKIYMKNIMILGHIRSWLPVPPNLQVHMLEHIGNGSLLHSNHKCTMYLIFALTNILVSDQGFIQTILIKSDIYRALVYLYKLVPMGCRQEIAIFMRNMAYKCDTGSLRIMLQTKLPDILAQMLKQTNSSIIIYALSTINVICKSLDQDYNNSMSQFLYTRRRFQIVLESLGAIKVLQSLVHSPQTQVVNKAMAALQLLN